MKIEKIKKLKSGKYKLELEDDETIVTYEDVIVDNGLLFKKELNEELLEKIGKDNEYYDIYHQALNYLNIRMRSRKEIKDYLKKKGCLESVIEEIILKLTEIGLINDYRFADALVKDKIYLSNYGPKWIEKELLKYHIDSEIIQKVINNIDNKFLYDKMTKLIDKQFKLNKRYSDYHLKQKIQYDLITKGYDSEMIKEILECKQVDENEIIEQEFNKLYRTLKLKHNDLKLKMKLKEKLYQKGFSKEAIEQLINEKIDIN